MAVESGGEFSGSVSGGCVESAVVQEALEVISTGKSKRIKYGVTDETAWEVGLACGGEIEIFISRLAWEEVSPVLNQINSGNPIFYQITLDQSGAISQPTNEELPEKYPYLDPTSTPEKFYLYVPPDPELVIVGGVNISQHLADFSKLIGYKITLIDPRKSFANPQRFPQVDQIINLWPEEAFNQKKVTSNTAIVILTHDDKIDIPALKLALDSDAFYIGALGSKKTQARRNLSLSESGVAEEKLKAIHGPIGLNIGANSPLEIALSIIAEITAVANLNQGRI